VKPARGSPALTVRGWGVLAAAAGLLVAARLFGSAELAGLAAAAGGSAGWAAFTVGRAPLSYRAERRLTPARVGAGQRAVVRLRFTNTGRTPTSGVTVATDSLTPGGGSGPFTDRSCSVPALGAGGVAEAEYELPATRRGVAVVGPLAISVGDRFGLAERRIEVAGTARLVVHPRIRPVLPLPGSSRPDARLGRSHPARAARGDDFFTLREYEVGDDLRRVHWRSTARTGDLMLRQDERRYGEVATVLLDTRALSHDAGSFERALEVAASVTAALVDDGRRVRFLTSGGIDVELDATRAAGVPAGGRAETRWNTVLEHLALASPDPGGAEHFARAVRSIARRAGGPLAAVMAGATPVELAALGGLSGRLGPVLIADCRPGGAGPADGMPGAAVVAVDDMSDFPDRWNQAVLSCSRRDVVRR